MTRRPALPRENRIMENSLLERDDNAASRSRRLTGVSVLGERSILREDRRDRREGKKKRNKRPSFDGSRRRVLIVANDSVPVRASVPGFPTWRWTHSRRQSAARSRLATSRSRR